MRPALLLSKLLLLDFPSMAWDLEQFIEATAAFFSLNAVASVLKTALTVAATAQAALSENPLAAPQGMADGRNALQGVGTLALLDPRRRKAAVLRHNSDGGMEMVGVSGAEATQAEVAAEMIKHCAQRPQDCHR